MKLHGLHCFYPVVWCTGFLYCMHDTLLLSAYYTYEFHMFHTVSLYTNPQTKINKWVWFLHPTCNVQFLAGGCELSDSSMQLSRLIIVWLHGCSIPYPAWPISHYSSVTASNSSVPHVCIIPHVSNVFCKDIWNEMHGMHHMSVKNVYYNVCYSFTQIFQYTPFFYGLRIY